MILTCCHCGKSHLLCQDCSFFNSDAGMQGLWLACPFPWKGFPWTAVHATSACSPRVTMEFVVVIRRPTHMILLGSIPLVLSSASKPSMDCFTSLLTFSTDHRSCGRQVCPVTDVIDGSVALSIADFSADELFAMIVGVEDHWTPNQSNILFTLFVCRWSLPDAGGEIDGWWQESSLLFVAKWDFSVAFRALRDEQLRVLFGNVVTWCGKLGVSGKQDCASMFLH